MTLDKNDKRMKEISDILDQLTADLDDLKKPIDFHNVMEEEPAIDVTEALGDKAETEKTADTVDQLLDQLPEAEETEELPAEENAPSADETYEENAEELPYEKTKWDAKREKREAKHNAKLERKAKIKSGEIKSTKGLKIAVAVVLVMVLALGGVIVAGMSIVNTQVDKVTKVQVNREALEIDPRVAEELKGYRNIVLLGIDARDMSNDENTRSDAMIVVSIEKATGNIRLISLYRDTYLSLGADYGLDKLTHAYFYGGATQTMRAINRNLDLNCEEVVVVNWKAVADAVDAMGGVEIDVKESEISELNKYIIDTYNTIGGSNELITSPGLQTLNGNQAVTYGRIRKDHVQGDHRRNERMKILLAAVFDKAKTMSFSELNSLTSEILPQVKTNMTNSQMMELLLDINAYNITDSVGWPYNSTSWTHNGIWYGPPVTLKSNVVQLHEELFAQPDYVPTDTVLKISDQISRLTGRW